MRGETVGIIPASDGGSPGGLSGLSLALGGNKTLSDLMWPVLGLSMTNLTVVVVSACSPSELWNVELGTAHHTTTTTTAASAKT